jgi:beta-lactamase class A
MLSRGTVGVAVENLRTGSVASINAQRTFPAASLFKVPILLEVLAQEAEGRLPPDRTLEIGVDDWSEGSGVLQARIGERLAVRELRRLMIQESDNIAALVLLDAVGAASVNARLVELGVRDTRVVDFRRGEIGQHSTTAADMAKLLSTAAQGRLIDGRVSEELLDSLELPQAHTWLAEGLPWWVKVAHKWGDLPDARNDVGVVFSPRGNYVVAVLTQDAAPDEAQRAITRVSQTVYEGLR